MDDSGLLPPGVHVLERGWLSANNIVFADGITAVVDTGYWTHQEQTVSLVSGLLGGKKLQLVLNTHLHSDHCGGNAALARHYPDAQILIPPGQSRHVQEWDANALTYVPTGQFCPPFRFNGLISGQDEIQLGCHLWQIHSAPGHDPHSIVLFEPNHRILISADALWENGFGVVFPELEGVQAFEAVAATLDLVDELRPLVIIPGHGPVFTDLGSALERARSRLDSFKLDPKKHAQHAAKVLLKFKLLEEQRISIADLKRWALSTRYFQVVHTRHFLETPQNEWLDRLMDELVSVNAAVRADRYLINF
jgi:glyoxylase-like metal-dependent hydrolase (beta-lactamase superfamily II)